MGLHHGDESLNILVTGAGGFVGRHLVALLRREAPGAEIFGLAAWWELKRGEGPGGPFLEGEELAGNALLAGDLTDLSSLVAALKRAQPDYIFHLAASSFVPWSYLAPAQVMQVNALGTVNLFEAIRLAAQDPKVIVCSSPEVFGDTREIITEATPLRPVSPYALSKCVEDLAAYMYHQAYGLRTVVSRGFAHEGPGRGAVFAVSDFARQIARIEAGLQPPVVKVGNLGAIRTYCDVRDMVRAYWLLSQKGEPGEAYNIAGDAMFSLQEVLDRLLALSHRGKEITAVVETARLRPHDVWSQRADDSKFRKLTGWRPELTFSQRTLPDILEYWRQTCGPLKP